MRRSQPNFVVEYKGERRKRRSPNTSIWGDLDLKSLSQSDDTDRVERPDANRQVAMDEEFVVPAEVDIEEEAKPDAYVTRATLAQLDAENVRLKALLARKLEDENLRLQTLLERFS